MILRAATPGDAPALAAILGDWVRETGWMPLLHSRAEDQWFAGHLIDTQQVQVAETEEPLGFLARDGAEISALYLAPQARGRGTGSALLEAAKAASPALHLWTFQANTGAQRFYLRHGFTETRRTDGAGNDERLPDIRYEWRRA